MPGSGRKPGTKNVATVNLKKAIGMFLEDKFEEFGIMMSMMKPSEYCRIYADLLKYAVPALQSVAVKDETEDGKRAAYNILADLRKGVINQLPPNLQEQDGEENEEEEA